MHEKNALLHFDTNGSMVNMCMKHYPGHMVFMRLFLHLAINRMQNIPQCLLRGIIALDSVLTVFLPSEVRQTIVSRIQHDVLKSDKVNI